MIAVSILSISLLALMNFQGQSLLASGRAQRISVSTLLARQKMAQVILDIEKGIPKGDFPDEKEESGGFDEEDFHDYFWKIQIKKIELPPASGPEGQSEMMAQAYQMLSEELSRSTREIRLTVGWKENEDENEGLTLVTHLVNPLGGNR